MKSILFFPTPISIKTRCCQQAITKLHNIKLNEILFSGSQAVHAYGLKGEANLRGYPPGCKPPKSCLLSHSNQREAGKETTEHKYSIHNICRVSLVVQQKIR
jgi:hypothetical protein